MQTDSLKVQEYLAIVTAVLTLINVTATIVYVVTTIFIAKFAKDTREISSGQLTKITEFEEARLRPYVLFNIISTEDRIYQSHIKNYGLTAAFDIEVSIEPSLMIFDADETDTVSSSKIFALPPNFEIVSDINSSVGFYERYPNPIFTGSVTYKDSKGVRYSEEFSIDLNFMKRKVSHDEESIAKEVKHLANEVRTVSRELQRVWVNDK